MGTKRFIAIATGVFLLISVFIIYVGYSANRQIEETVAAQFNHQQLILARQVANNIRHHLRFLGTSLLALNQSWELGPKYRESIIRSEANAHFMLLKDWDVLAAGRLSRDGKMFVVSGDVSLAEKVLTVDRNTLWQWGANPENCGKILLGRTFSPTAGPFRKHRLLLVFTPAYRKDTQFKDDGRYRFEGVSFLITDAIAIAERYAREVRSGQTGYAWVVDQDGVFLSHYDQSFVGQDFFTIRQKKNPHISWTRINKLTREHLLRGEEGTDWYVSGWHRGLTGEMKKLFAYTPIRLSKQGAVYSLWSVAVVAPSTEVYGAIQSLVVRQWLTVGAFQMVVFGCLAMAVYFSLRWSQMLHTEVERKTTDLMRSEEEVRNERDKVKESMEKLIKTQEALIRSERFAAIGEAAAHVSHEIKNPLMLIGGFAAQIEKSLPPDDPNAGKLEIITKEVQRLEQLLTMMDWLFRTSS